MNVKNNLTYILQNQEIISFFNNQMIKENNQNVKVINEKIEDENKKIREINQNNKINILV